VNGWQDHAVWITKKIFDTKTMSCAFEALDVEHLMVDLATPPDLEALTLDPVAVEDLFSDDTAAPLYADS